MRCGGGEGGGGERGGSRGSGVSKTLFPALPLLFQVQLSQEIINRIGVSTFNNSIKDGVLKTNMQRQKELKVHHETVRVGGGSEGRRTSRLTVGDVT